jgi:hypothetical protein
MTCRAKRILDIRRERDGMKHDAAAKWLAKHDVTRPLNKSEWLSASPDERDASRKLVQKLRQERRKERKRLRRAEKRARSH